MQRTSFSQTLAGYLVIYAALELAGRALDGWGLAAGKSAAAMVGLATACLVQALLSRERDPKRVLLSLGFGWPDTRVLFTSAVVGAALLATMPLIVAATGGTFVLPDNWPALALGILLLNGIAEETVFRVSLSSTAHSLHISKVRRAGNAPGCCSARTDRCFSRFAGWRIGNPGRRADIPGVRDV